MYNWKISKFLFNFRVFPIGSLRIYNLSVEDSGIYECIASNQYGDVSARAALTVEGELPLCALNII